MLHGPAHDVAHQILAQEIAAADAASAEHALEAAERAFQRVSTNLVRWLGPDGTHALFARALVLAQRESPALGTVPPPIRSALLLDTVAANVGPHDTDAVREATAMILAALIELLGRLIGNDLALRLVAEQPLGEGTTRTGRGAHPEGGSWPTGSQ